MAQSLPFAPVRILEMCVRETHFKVVGEPADAMSLSMRINMDKTEVLENEETREYELPLNLGIDVSLVNKEDVSDIRMSAFVNVVSVLSVACDGISAEDALRYLRINGLSMSYAHARSFLMTLAAMSPMQSFILPPVIPDVLLNQLLYDDSAGDGKEP